VGVQTVDRPLTDQNELQTKTIRPSLKARRKAMQARHLAVQDDHNARAHH
jgi:hypothetical protein